MPMIVTALVLVYLACGLMLVRNNLVFRIRMEAVDRVSRRAKVLIQGGDHTSWRQLYDRLDTPSYDAMMFDLTLWTFAAAYPWLCEPGSSPPDRETQP